MTLIDVQDGVQVSSILGGIVKGGTFTIPAFEQSVIVTHGLGTAPAWAIAGSGNSAGRGCQVTAKTSTTITIEITDAQVVDATGYWAVSL